MMFVRIDAVMIQIFDIGWMSVRRSALANRHFLTLDLQFNLNDIDVLKEHLTDPDFLSVLSLN